MGKIYFFIVALCIPGTAFAYLDPGSGNALVYLVISLFGAITYFLKTAFYKVLSFIKGEKYEQKVDDNIVIFSEGKNYWLTFKPVIEALIERKVPFTYLTMDVEDPALTIENDHMHSKYVGEGSVGFSRVAHRSALVMLSTTPNMGCPGFPLPRPQNVKCLAHIWHSVCDTGFYHMGALDHYDAALVVGDWTKSSIRKIEELRRLKQKEIVAVGLPYLDELSYSVKSSTKENEKKTILVAPSWGPKSCLAVYGTEFLAELAKQNYEVIVRPHPQSLKVEKDFIDEIQETLENVDGVYFDFAVSGADSMAKADLLISDKSSIRFDFAFLYEKPVLTLDIPLANLDIYEASLLDGLWEETQSDKIGKRLTIENKEKILSAVQETICMQPADIRSVRESTIANWQCSGKAIAEWTISKIAELKNKSNE